MQTILNLFSAAQAEYTVLLSLEVYGTRVIARETVAVGDLDVREAILGDGMERTAVCASACPYACLMHSFVALCSTFSPATSQCLGFPIPFSS